MVVSRSMTTFEPSGAIITLFIFVSLWVMRSGISPAAIMLTILPASSRCLSTNASSAATDALRPSLSSEAAVSSC